MSVTEHVKNKVFLDVPLSGIFHRKIQTRWYRPKYWALVRTATYCWCCYKGFLFGKKDKIMKERLMRKLETSYEFFMGNRNPQRARVVCIGEVHPYTIELDQKVRLANGTREAVDHIIATIARPGDILLIERHASLVEADEGVLRELEHNIPSWLTVYGWDDMALRKKALDLGDDSIRVGKEEAKTRPMYAGVPGQFRNRYSESAELWRESYKVAMERNSSLQKTIQLAEKRLHRGNKLFVVAGIDHWTKDVVLQKWLKRYKFAMLIPNGQR